MTSAEDFLDALNCTIRFTTPEGDYEGVLKQVFITARMITVGKVLFLLSNTKLGTLNFMFHEISNIKILNRLNIYSENVTETSLIYFRRDIDEMFNLDGDSDAESECKVPDEPPEEEIFELKLLPCFIKVMSSDSQIIDSLNNEFKEAIRHILNEDSIGVSLEGPKISRNGILTWLCISTSACTYLFDILSLGEKSFKNGLKSILENSKIKKIFHDCRLASDCLFHMYNVCLVNVFDTQVADSLAMMQQTKNCSIIKQVNSLDTCLSYYLQLPDEYLCVPLAFNLEKESIHYHGLRPLRNSFRSSLIKSVIYLRILKREIETALLTPLRRATDVYLNVIQNATDRELMVAPPILDELPPELLLEGIQIVRYQQYEYIPPIVSSGPPYRKLVNPVKDFVEGCRQFRNKGENKINKDDKILQNGKASKFLFMDSSEKASECSSQSSRYFSKLNNFNQLKSAGNESNIDECLQYNDNQISDNLPLSSYCDSMSVKENYGNEILQDISIGENIMVSKTQPFLGNLSIKMKQIKVDEKNFYLSAKAVNNSDEKQIADNSSITNYKVSSNSIEKDTNEVVKNSFIQPNTYLSNNVHEVLNPVGNCLLRERAFEERSIDKEIKYTQSSSITTSKSSSTPTSFLHQEDILNVHPTFNSDCEDLWDKIRKECIHQQSNSDESNHRPKIRFIPAGMASF